MAERIVAVDAEAKRTRHETVFPQECEKAFGMGAALLRNH